MKRRRDLTAAQTALLACLGAVMVSSGFAVLWLLRSAHTRAFSVGISLALFALGFFISLKSESDLKEGVANQRWDENQIEPVRNLFESPWWKVLSIGLLVASIGLMVIVRLHNIGVTWAFLFPAMATSRLTMAVRPPRTSKPPIDWNNFGPIHSDQWGRR